MSQAFYTNIRPYGDSILFIGYNKDGERVQKKIQYEPELYYPQSGGEFKSYDGEELVKKPFNSIKEMKGFLAQYEDVENFKVYGSNQATVQFISKYFKGKLDYSFPLIRTFHLDIETMSDEGFPEPRHANSKITAITIKDSRTGGFITWGVKKFKPHIENLEYREFSLDTEKEMLIDFLSFWQMNYPDVVTGWNIRGFDIPYLYNRLCKILGEKLAKKLSPWGIVFEKKTNTQKLSTGKDELNYDLYGISELDYLDLYKKYTQGEEAMYKLDHIAFVVLGERKLDFEGTLHNLFMTDYQKYVEYNIKDVDLVERIEKKLKYLQLIIQIAYMGKVPTYNDALGTTKYWETMIFHHLYSKKIIPPVKGKAGEKLEQFTGAFVKSPKPGKYKWLCGYDLASLYPSLMMQLSIGPETLIEDMPDEVRALSASVSVEGLISGSVNTDILKKYGYSMSATGSIHAHIRSFLSELVDEIFQGRQKDKKKSQKLAQEYQATKDEALNDESIVYDIKQHAAKILINSVYGACGSKYFQYFNIKNAEAITVTGRYVIQKTHDVLNETLNKINGTTDIDFVVGVDTDSCYLNLEPIVNKVFKEQTDKQKITDFIDQLCKKKLDPVIKQTYEDIFNQLNCFDNRLVMKREAIASEAIWKAKKRYAMNVLDNEGVRFSEPKFKVTGLEVVSSSTPMVVQDALERAIKTMLDGDQVDLQDYISSFKKEFKTFDVKDIAISKGMSDMESYIHLPKGTPAHVKGAILFNKLLAQHDLTKVHETIKSGNKLKIIPLKTPNIVQTDAIAFIDKLPKEFGLQKYVDYDTQFEKVFIKPLEPLAQLVGWELTKRNRLSDFY